MEKNLTPEFLYETLVYLEKRIKALEFKIISIELKKLENGEVG